MVLDARAPRGKREEIKALVAEAAQAGVRLSDETFQDLIAIYVRRRDVKTSLHWLKYARSIGVPPSVDLYGMVIRSFCEAGKVQVAETLFAELKRAGCTGAEAPWLLRSLYRGNCYAGNIKRALHWLARLQESPGVEMSAKVEVSHWGVHAPRG